jgi:hypothetical protein
MQTTIKHKSDYKSDEFYRFYKNNYSEVVDKKLYSDITRDFFNIIFDRMIFNNETFQLPYEMGEMFIGKKKQKSFEALPINWKETKELWDKDPVAKENKVLVKHFNRHTDGYIFRFIWSKLNAKFIKKSLYRFRPIRAHARKMSAAAQDPKSKIDFFEIR